MSEPTPQDQMTPPTLADNRASGGQSPRSKPTAQDSLRRLLTIGTRGQERGED